MTPYDRPSLLILWIQGAGPKAPKKNPRNPKLSFSPPASATLRPPPACGAPFPAPEAPLPRRQCRRRCGVAGETLKGGFLCPVFGGFSAWVSPGVKKENPFWCVLLLFFSHARKLGPAIGDLFYPFFGEGSPTKIDYKRSTLIKSSLLEDLAFVFRFGPPKLRLLFVLWCPLPS